MAQRIALAMLAFALTLAANADARAQVIVDLSKMTCKQFVTYKVANPKSIAIWLSGYYHGTRKELRLDTQELDARADAVQDYCFKNPEEPLLQAVEKVVGSAK
jgi:acid stress chaperone HdeB